jgi:hypothetical protein
MSAAIAVSRYANMTDSLRYHCSPRCSAFWSTKPTPLAPAAKPVQVDAFSGILILSTRPGLHSTHRSASCLCHSATLFMTSVSFFQENKPSTRI